MAGRVVEAIAPSMLKITISIIAILIVFLLIVKSTRYLKAQRKRRAEFSQHVAAMKEHVRAFEQAKDFDEKIRYLSFIVSSASKAGYVEPDNRIVREIIEACDNERRRLTLNHAVEVAGESMEQAAKAESFRIKVNNARQAFNTLKICSRLLFFHENITNAMRLADAYMEAFSGDSQDAAACQKALAEGQKIFLQFNRIFNEIKREAVEAEKDRLDLAAFKSKVESLL